MLTLALVRLIDKEKQMSKIRIIKKYPNRRLYDTSTSSYITLAGVKDLILEYVPFKIINSRCGEDLTRTSILQIVAEEESSFPIFSSELLMGLIRSYGDSTQAMLSRFLEHSLQEFIKKQGQLKNPMSTLPGESYSLNMKQLAETNLQSWENSETNKKQTEQAETQRDEERVV